MFGSAEFGAVVSKKTLKSAVGRNRIRRRIYEVLRNHLDGITPNSDVVLLVVSPELRTMPANELETSVLELLIKAGLYKSTSETGIL